MPDQRKLVDESKDKDGFPIEPGCFVRVKCENTLVPGFTMAWSMRVERIEEEPVLGEHVVHGRDKNCASRCAYSRDCRRIADSRVPNALRLGSMGQYRPRRARKG